MLQIIPSTSNGAAPNHCAGSSTQATEECPVCPVPYPSSGGAPNHCAGSHTVAERRVPTEQWWSAQSLCRVLYKIINF